ncbi:unnamed protein product [Rotaria sp. Silwood2]|nr:unnamed protein product [Rotaria sp. Silwood2]
MTQPASDNFKHDNHYYNHDIKTARFLDQVRTTLAPKDFNLFKEVINEWLTSSSYKGLELKWKHYQRANERHGYSSSSLNILCFNIRGLDLRWGDVCLLVKKHLTDIIVLEEVGRVDFALISAALSNYNIFYQAGENAHGGILVMIRNDILVVKLDCSLPNICVLDLQLEQIIRLIAIYAPASKTWEWADLSSFVTNCCMIMGDFNIDIEQDGDQADKLLEWMDSCNLEPVVPDSNTSLRSNRTIDYAITVGVELTMQVYEGDTTSDHKPLLGVLGFLSPNGKITKDSQIMADTAADYYEKLFEAPIVMRPHPYVDAPPMQWENEDELITTVTYPEILNILHRGILPDNQSGFRAEFRLQTRVLLLIEQISSYMSNSSSTATVFVDFKSAFDQLWFEGCLGKLTRMGIPTAYVNWIRAWLNDRKAVIEVKGKRSRWIKIHRGCPQGSSFSPTLFITYHSDMADYLPGEKSFFFADDLAAVFAGQIGIRFTNQCIDLERRLQNFLDQLELYSILSVQPINYSKTQAMFSARAVSYPNPLSQVRCGDHSLEWITSFKYLGYWLSTKLGWGSIIRKTTLIVRQRTALVNSFRINDGYLLCEQSELNTHRSKWQEGESSIRCLRRSKRFVPHRDILERVFSWMTTHGTSDSVIPYNIDELLCFSRFPETFI